MVEGTKTPFSTVFTVLRLTPMASPPAAETLVAGEPDPRDLVEKMITHSSSRWAWFCAARVCWINDSAWSKLDRKPPKNGQTGWFDDSVDGGN